MGALALAFLMFTLPLIGTLHSIEFQTGRNTGVSSTPTAGGPPAEAYGWKLVTLLVRLFATAAALVFVFELVFNRSFRWFFLSIALLLGAIAFMSARLSPDQPSADGSFIIETQELWQSPVETDAQSHAENGDAPLSKTQAMLVAIALSVLMVSALALGLHRWLQTKSSQPVDFRDAVLGNIENATRRLRAGEDARMVVLFCYQEMMRILSATGKLDATCLTPREFERRLHHLGLSGNSIKNLTALFEIVRYASRADEDFASKALACLDAVRAAHAEEAI